jgi:hypothetical protein
MARICLGEFDWPDQRGKQQFVQGLFLNTVAKLDQAPLKQLYGVPLELYRMAKNEFHLEHYFIRQPWMLTGPAVSLVETLEAEIESWAKTWNVDAPWCRKTALETLHLWSCASREMTQLVFQYPVLAGFVPPRLEPPEGLPSYAAFEMTRDWYLEKIRSGAREAIAKSPLLRHGFSVKARAFVDSTLVEAKTYCDAVEAVYLEHDWKRCRQNEKKNLNQHLEWTVKFQVSGKTFSELAEDANVEQSTVSRAVRDILSILPLAKRPDSRPGRIRGRRNKRFSVSG